MKHIFDRPALGVALVVLVTILLFAPTIIGIVRRVKTFAAISALNALLLLTTVSILAWTWFIWVTVALWIAATFWAFVAKRAETT